MNFLNEAQALEGEMRAFFEDLHRHPEPSHFENRTNQRIREQLRAHQIDMLCPKDNITIAVIRGAKPGKTVGLRFDRYPAPAWRRSPVPAGRLPCCPS